MFYEFAITVPHATLKLAPVTLELKLTAGTIQSVYVQFPPGCAGLVHCALLHQEHQLYPLNPDGDLAADGAIIPIEDESFDLGEPYALKFVGWSDDDTFAHVLRVRVSVIRPGELEAKTTWIGGLKNLLKLAGIG